MTETTATFHPTYADVVRGLPPSQLREAYKRLSTAKSPLTDAEILSEHPRVAACLEKISQAYGRKKTRSAVASKARRDAARETIERLTPGVVSEADACEIADLAAPLEACSLEPVAVECATAPATPATPATPAEVPVQVPPLDKKPLAKPLAKPPAKSPAKPLAASMINHSVAHTTATGKLEAAAESSGRKFFTNQK
jgi:hypothetical protein